MLDRRPRRRGHGGELFFSAIPGGFYRLGTDQKVTQVLAGPTNGSFVPAGGSGVTNLTFGGPDRDTVFTTVDNKGLHRIPVATRGFPGHPGAAMYTVKRYLP